MKFLKKIFGWSTKPNPIVVQVDKPNHVDPMQESAPPARSNNTIDSALIAIPGHHGYFWHPSEGQVYSIKVTGTLKKLHYYANGCHFGGYNSFKPGWYLSHKGKKTVVTKDYLRTLKHSTYMVPKQ